MSWLVLAAACGGMVSGNQDGGADGGAGGVACPPTLPAEATSCARLGLECEYGDNSDYLCNTVTSCSSGSWVYYKNNPTNCSTGVESGCPPTSSQVPKGAVCTVQNTRCNYPDIVCECTMPAGPIQIDDAGNTVSSWVCEQPAQACPIPRPKIGSACSLAPDVSCDYGSCSLEGGVLLFCSSGAWQRASVMCPL